MLNNVWNDEKKKQLTLNSLHFSLETETRESKGKICWFLQQKKKQNEIVQTFNQEIIHLWSEWNWMKKKKKKTIY